MVAPPDAGCTVARGDGVKVELFHLMRYRDLPADFAAQYRSVWVDVYSHSFDATGAYQMYNIWPRPLEQPHPPIGIPGGGSIETWGWCPDGSR